MTKEYPWSADAEMSVLGSCILDNRAIDKASATLTPDMFYRVSHELIFRVCLKLRNAGEAVDIVTIRDALGDDLEKVGGLSYLMQIADFVPSPANVKYYASIVAEKHQRRCMLIAAEEMKTDAYDESKSIDDSMGSLMEKASNIAGRRIESDIDIAKLAVESIESMFDTSDSCKFGVYDLDGLLDGGLAPGELTCVGARPSIGKTSSVVQWVARACQENKGKVLVFTTEDRKGFVRRLITHQSGVSMVDIRTMIDDEKIVKQLKDATKKVEGFPLKVIDDSCVARLDAESIANVVASERASGAIRLIVVDFIQDVTVSQSQQRNNRYEQIAHIGRTLRRIATTTNIHVLITAQLGRESEGRTPRLSDLRECGDLEQLCWNVLLLHQETAREKADTEEEILFHVAKHRNGGTGVVKVLFQRDIGRWLGVRKNNLFQ